MLCLCFQTIAQSPKLLWSDDTKVPGAPNQDLIYADHSGVYLWEQNFSMKTYFVVGAVLGGTYTLRKYDQNLEPIFEKSYDQELKDYIFVNVFGLKEQMYFFAAQKNKGNNTISFFGTKLNKTTGGFLSPLQKIATISMGERKDNLFYEVGLTPDSSQIVLVVDLSTKKRSNISVNAFDFELKPNQSTSISFSYESNDYKFESLFVTPQKRVFIVGRKYDNSAKMYNYSIDAYNASGKKEFELPVDFKGNYFQTTGYAIDKNNLVVAGYFSVNTKRIPANGIYVMRYDLNSGALIHQTFKPFSSSSFGKSASRYLDKGGIPVDVGWTRLIKNEETGSLILISEKDSVFSMSEMQDISRSARTTIVHRYYNRDVLVSVIDVNDVVSSVNVIPKVQELISDDDPWNYHGDGLVFIDRNFMNTHMARIPLFYSYYPLVYANMLHLFFNDHKKNVNITKADDDPKKENDPGKSTLFDVAIDLKTGHVTRTAVFSNDDFSTTAAPKFSEGEGGNVYIPTLKEGKFFSKPKFKIVKLSYNP
jgi:hypothetical protein